MFDRAHVSDSAGTIQSFSDAYSELDVDLRKYIIPQIVISSILLLVVVLTDIPYLITVPVFLLSLLGMLATIAYPRLNMERRRSEINERFNLFITHMTILSMTTIDRVEIFRILAQEESEYAELARECRRIVTLVDSLNMSLDKAVEVRSESVPSELLSEFFERMAYVLGAGQKMNDFMVDEHDSLQNRYESMYQASLDNVGVVKEIYISILLTTTFILVFALLLPLLMDISPMITLLGIIMFFIIIQVALLRLLDQLLPYDPIWHNELTPQMKGWKRIYKAMLVSTILTAITSVLFISMMFDLIIDPTGGMIPGPLHIALAIVPLIYSGWVVRQEEANVKERDDSYPQFIRSLGTVEMTKQTNTSNILKDLRKREFGELNALIDELYKRLKTNISEDEAWDMFTRDSGSYIVKKFSDMYVIGRRMGSNPDKLGEIISTNVNSILSLREDRRQTASTFVGMVYGLNAAVTFSMFIALEITNLLVDISGQLGTVSGALGSDFLSASAYAGSGVIIDPMMYMVYLVLAVSGGIMIRKLDGGHILNSQIHIVVLVWLNSLTATLVIYGSEHMALFN